MNYDTVIYLLGEDENPRLKTLQIQKENIKKQIKGLQEQIKKFQEQITNIDKQITTLGGSILDEDAKFELDMLLAEKDLAKKTYLEKNPKGKISFFNFNKAGIEDETCQIKTDKYNIFFHPDSISYYKGEDMVGSKSYEEIYKVKENKWNLIFDFSKL